MKKILFIFLPFVLVASESRIEEHSFFSKSLEISKNINILLPADYDSTLQRYPVVYLFRGHENEWADSWEDNSRNGRNIKTVYDECYKAGLIDEMILVMPGVSSADNAIPGLGVNFSAVALANDAEGIGTGKFEDYIVKDIIDYIDQNFRTVNRREFRATDGFSLGGYTSVNLITRHPEVFISVGGYDGTLMWLDFNDLRHQGDNDDYTWLSTGMFDPIFGLPRDVEYMKSYNASNLVYYGTEAFLDSLRHIQFLLHSGASPEGSNRIETQHFVDLLAEKGIENYFRDIRLTEDAIHNWHFADLHMEQTLPCHFQKFQQAKNTLDLHFTENFEGNTLSGTHSIVWDFSNTIDSFVTIINYKTPSNQRWQRLAELSDQEKSWLWNTELYNDGVNFQIQLQVFSNGHFAKIETDKFTINNAGPAAPEIKIFAPTESDTISGIFDIQWLGGDADGDPLLYSIFFSADRGHSWNAVGRNLNDIHHLSWNTVVEPNSPFCRLLLMASDGYTTVSDTSKIFTLFNERWYRVLDSAEHVAGHGNGKIYVSMIIEPDLYGHNYEILFQQGPGKTYSVKETKSGEIVIDQQVIPPYPVEGEMFYGIRLIIDDYSVAEIDMENTGWEIGASPYNYYVNLPTLVLGTEVIHGYPYPADYRIKFFDQVADTSCGAFGVLPVPVPFTIENVTENRRANVIFIDNDGDGYLTRNDVIYFLEKDMTDEWMICWELSFSGNPSDVPPQPGDIFQVRTLKPFTEKDIFRFGTGTLSVSDELVAEDFHFSAYPNPFNPTTNIQIFLQQSANIKLTIFDLQGRLIKTLSRQYMTTGNHKIVWNATDDNGQKVSSGIYFCQLNIGEKSITQKLTLLR
ncbi:MAG: T9SS type A sorting domain-containing protein [Candidatus Marinimicrobia bacterium]|nr:T9SS type A sorting domain-containing protein [Candidatus Neomarinimicrobiota bacterium]